MIGKLTVIRLSDLTFTQTNLTDIHPDSFEFTPDGKHLYVVSATSGSDAQKANARNNIVLLYDTSALPTLTFVKEIAVGVAEGSHRAITLYEKEGKAKLVVVPNPTDNTVSLIDAETQTVVDTIGVGSEPGAVLVFPLEGDLSHSD